jgi:hypothetical protein
VAKFKLHYCINAFLIFEALDVREAHLRAAVLPEAELLAQLAEQLKQDEAHIEYSHTEEVA